MDLTKLEAVFLSVVSSSIQTDGKIDAALFNEVSHSTVTDFRVYELECHGTLTFSPRCCLGIHLGYVVPYYSECYTPVPTRR